MTGVNRPTRQPRQTRPIFDPEIFHDPNIFAAKEGTGEALLRVFRGCIVSAIVCIQFKRAGRADGKAFSLPSSRPLPACQRQAMPD